MNEQSRTVRFLLCKWVKHLHCAEFTRQDSPRSFQVHILFYSVSTRTAIQQTRHQAGSTFSGFLYQNVLASCLDPQAQLYRSATSGDTFWWLDVAWGKVQERGLSGVC